MKSCQKLVKSKRPVLLLEVMIAFALIAMAAIPLISPYIYLIRVQRSFTLKVELDHAVSLLFVDLLEKLYQNRIPFSAMLDGTPFELKEGDYARVGYPGLPFKGFFKFRKVIQKPKNEDSLYTLYHFEVDYHFFPTGEKAAAPLIYSYHLFVVRDLGQETLPEGNPDEETDEG